MCKQLSSADVRFDLIYTRFPEPVALLQLAGSGIGQEDAISMVVNGFCKEVFDKLPMEFAVEATKLLSVSLEGSVG